MKVFVLNNNEIRFYKRDEFNAYWVACGKPALIIRDEGDILFVQGAFIVKMKP